VSAVITSETDRFGRPLSPDPVAIPAPTNPVGVHVIPMCRPDEYRWAKKAGAGVDWHDRGRWRTEHVLHLPLPGGDRWIAGYEDDTAIVNHGEGAARTIGRSLWAIADSSCISAHPDMGTAGDIRRWKANGQWHEAAFGDLVILECREDDGELFERVAVRLVPKGWGGQWLGLELVQR
jgi:hypothetical protein